MQELEKKLNYTFRNQELLREALNHSSYANEHRSQGLGSNERSAARTAPGPETPTWISQSGSPGPWNAPAMKGLSSGALQNTTSFAAPMH